MKEYVTEGLQMEICEEKDRLPVLAAYAKAISDDKSKEKEEKEDA